MATLNVSELPDMPESSAVIFSQLPAQVQRDPAVVEAASTLKAKDFFQKMHETCPDAHLEVCKFIKLTASQKAVFEMALVVYQRDDPTCSLGEFLELTVQNWLQEQDQDA